jgi:osmotically inducible protein OsmC
MNKRTATVTWHGPGKNGSGHISTASNLLEKAPYTYGSRFEDQRGTNPEELIAAAHAACFTMKLSFLIGEAGFTPTTIETTAEVTLEKDSISHSHLHVQATVPEMPEDKFTALVDNARENCLVSKALNMEITSDAELTEQSIAL